MIPSGIDTKKPSASPQAPSHGGQHQGGGGFQFAGGDRPEALRGMLPVLLHVAHIVDEVDGGAHQAERDEGQRSALEHGWLEKPPSGQRSGEDEEVLDPLAGSHSADRGRHSAAANSNLRGFGHQDATLSIPSQAAAPESEDTTLEPVRIKGCERRKSRAAARRRSEQRRSFLCERRRRRRIPSAMREQLKTWRHLLRGCRGASWLPACGMQRWRLERFQLATADRLTSSAAVDSIRRHHPRRTRLPQWTDSAVLAAAYCRYQGEGGPAEQRHGCRFVSLAGGAEFIPAPRVAGGRFHDHRGQSGGEHHDFHRSRMERQLYRRRPCIGGLAAAAVTG